MSFLSSNLRRALFTKRASWVGFCFIAKNLSGKAKVAFCTGDGKNKVQIFLTRQWGVFPMLRFAKNAENTKWIMKIKLMIGMVMVALLPGCFKPSADPRIAQMQDEIKTLAKENTDMTALMQQLSDQDERTFIMASNTMLIATMAFTNSETVPIDRIIADARMAAMESEIGAITNYLRGRMPRRAAPSTTPTTAPAQMPADIAAQIRAAAEAKWPNDYDMQSYEIKEQTEAWHKLNP